MPFGKHKDESIASLCDDEPEYLQWLTENTDVEFTDDVTETMKIGLAARKR